MTAPIAHQLHIPGRDWIDCTPEAAEAERQRGGRVRELVDAREVEHAFRIGFAKGFPASSSSEVHSECAAYIAALTQETPR